MLIDDFQEQKNRQNKLNIEPPTPTSFDPNQAWNAGQATTPVDPYAGMGAPNAYSYPVAASQRPKGILGKLRAMPRRGKIIIGVMAIILIGGGIGLAAAFGGSDTPAKEVAKETPAEQAKPAEAPKPTTEESRLSGLQVAPELNKRPVTAIMIENSPDARPQSGMLEAGIVFEAIAEGGITRFLALYQEGRPSYIGPVRSLRPYYIDWLLPFDAPVAHVGGSVEALDFIRQPGQKDLDQFFNAGTYSRIPERFAPHNVYTNMDRLDALNQAKGYTSSTFTSWLRKADSKVATPNASSIDFNISSYYYNSHYDYDAPSNSYVRSMGGERHTDEKSGKPMNPKVILGLVMPYQTYGSADGYRSFYGTTGTGAMLVFQDGTVTSGNWSKKDRTSQFEFTDSAGNPLKLNTGQTWVTIASSADEISFR